MTLQSRQRVNNLSNFLKTQNSWQGLFPLPFDLVKNMPRADNRFFEKMADSAVTYSQCGRAPSKFTLTTKPVLTQFLLSYLFKWVYYKNVANVKQNWYKIVCSFPHSRIIGDLLWNVWLNHSWYLPPLLLFLSKRRYRPARRLIGMEDTMNGFLIQYGFVI